MVELNINFQFAFIIIIIIINCSLFSQVFTSVAKHHNP